VASLAVGIEVVKPLMNIRAARYNYVICRATCLSTGVSRASVSGRMDVYYAQKFAKYVQNAEVDV